MSNRWRSGLTLLAAVAVPLAVGGLGAVSTSSSIPTWYRGLRKPGWTPPARLFAPVWTTLYILMGVSVWLVSRSGLEKREVRGAVGLFGGQLALNALWSQIFFGLKAPGLALAEILLLWGVLVATVVRFFRIRPLAALLLLPYLLWTTYATTLNAGVWWLNRNNDGS